MKPQQALAVLDQAAALAKLDRREHALVLEAIETLAPLVAPDDNKDVTPA